MVFFDGGQRKPRILGHAARFARVESEVRAEDFLEGGFFGGEDKTNVRLPHPPLRAHLRSAKLPDAET